MSTSFQHIRNASYHGPERISQERPAFSSQKTTDRLREAEKRPSTPRSITKLKPQRRSIFKELGLDDLEHSVYNGPKIIEHPLPLSTSHDEKSEDGLRQGKVTFDDILKDIPQEQIELEKKHNPAAWLPKLSRGARPMIKSSASAPPGGLPTLSRSAMLMCLIAVCVPSFQYYGSGKEKIVVGVADAAPTMMQERATLDTRQNSDTATCTRWATQVANVNGTVYIYGGNSKQSSDQTYDTWNNDFLSLDLTKTWDRASPALTGLPQPSGPPAVALGALWHSRDALWLYGGMFSDKPAVSPLPVSTWKYDLAGKSWEEFENPQTSAGNFSDGGGKPVQRSAEGAALSVPENGRAYYFSGHLDLHTTEGWSNQVARVYLKSFLEFTFPGYANTGVQSLGSDKAAPREGIYRNITEGGVQDSAAFTERADGVLVYIPGWGSEGIILGLAGGTDQSFTEINTIDVYDVASSTWYKQTTTGKGPKVRVNPCAVVAAAPDGSSFNVYLYGGQNLNPEGQQTQYSDMWILTVPSFTWVQVTTDSQEPPARAGHSCVLWDAQMVVIGGYVGTELSCDSPGIYVFDTSTLQWTGSYNALSAGQSKAEEALSGSSIIRSSYGYKVPKVVQDVIGGNSDGGATATQPASGPATGGPIATGKPPTFTVTQSGSVVTQTAVPTGPVTVPAPTQPPIQAENKGSNVGAIVAGVVAGLLALLAAYLAFCTWLYRRQLNLYKNHVAMAQRTGFNSSPDPGDWSGNNSLGRNTTAEKPMLGPFGTAIGASTSNTDTRTSHSSQAHMSRPSDESGVYGGGAIPGRGYAGYNPSADGSVDGRPSTALSSSTEDLVGGLEPSFFSVVWNPRKTLRVVNSD